MHNGLITIITVCYNAVEGLEKTIPSVLGQKNVDFEYVVVDGGSTDGSLKVIKNYENSLVWISEKDNGIYDAMNKAIGMATGEWLCFMNAGDIFVNDHVLLDISEYLKQSDLQVVYGNIVRVFNSHKERKYPIRNNRADAVDFMIGNIDHQAAFIRKNLFTKYGLYDVQYRLAADHYFFLKAVGIGREKCKYVDHDVAYFMMDGRSTHSVDKYKQEKESMYNREFGQCYPYMRELAEYRASTILRYLLRIRMAIKNTGFNAFVRKCLNFRIK